MLILSVKDFQVIYLTIAFKLLSNIFFMNRLINIVNKYLSSCNMITASLASWWTSSCLKLISTLLWGKWIISTHLKLTCSSFWVSSLPSTKASMISKIILVSNRWFYISWIIFESEVKLLEFRRFTTKSSFIVQLLLKQL